MMFPPVVLSLFCLVLFLLCLPLGKLPLSLLALEKGLHLREQDTGQGFHFMEGDSRAVVVGLLFSRHRAAPCSKSFLVEQIALKYCPVVEQETASCILWYHIRRIGIVKDDLRKYVVRPTADPAINVVSYLPR